MRYILAADTDSIIRIGLQILEQFCPKARMPKLPTH